MEDLVSVNGESLVIMRPSKSEHRVKTNVVDCIKLIYIVHTFIICTKNCG